MLVKYFIAINVFLFLVGFYLDTTAVLDIDRKLPFYIKKSERYRSAIDDYAFTSLVPQKTQKRYLASIAIVTFSITTSLPFAVIFQSYRGIAVLLPSSLAGLVALRSGYKRYKCQ